MVWGTFEVAAAPSETTEATQNPAQPLPRLEILPSPNQQVEFQLDAWDWARKKKKKECVWCVKASQSSLFVTDWNNNNIA